METERAAVHGYGDPGRGQAGCADVAHPDHAPPEEVEAEEGPDPPPQEADVGYDGGDLVYAILSENATTMSQHVRNPHVTLRCTLTDGEIVFHVGKLTTESIAPSRVRST